MGNSIFTINKPNFEKARLLAYKLLLEQENPYINMKAEDIITNNKKIYFDTLQNYMSITNTQISDFALNNKLPLGFTINIDDNIHIILNNNNKSQRCRNWANIHEIGHIYMGHTHNGDKEEVEAHFFSACFLMPDPVINEFKKLGFNVDDNFLIKHFNVSVESAKRKIRTMKQYNFPSKYDRDIRDLLYKDIDRISDNIYDECFEYSNFSDINITSWS